MTNKELDTLESVFVACLDGGRYQGKSKIVKKLAYDGYLEIVRHAVDIHGYELTGNGLTVLYHCRWGG